MTRSRPVDESRDGPVGEHAEGGSEMARLFASTDWAATELGAVDTWPARLRMAVDSCLSSRFPMLVCWGADLVMIYNDGYRAMLGTSKHPYAWGRPVREVWPEIWPVIGPMFEGVLAGGPATWVEDQRLDVDRFGFVEETYFTYSYGAIHDDDGDAVVGVLNVATEVTDKVLAERRAAVSAQLLSALAEAPDADSVRRRTLEVLTAHTQDHAEVDLVWGDEASADEASGSAGERGLHVLPVTEPGLASPTAHLLLRANPRRPWDPLLQAYAELCVSHISLALSGLRRLDEERRRAEVLTELDTAKSYFFANVSHELRTPLTLIRGPVEDALADPGTDPEQRSRLELVRRSTERLTGLVDRILDLTRVEAGAVEPHWVDTDVAALVSGLAANFRPAIERLGIDFEVQVEHLHRRAHVDVDMLERIVLNLLSNALKFTPGGSIELRLTGDDTGYTIAVSDTGIGIAEADLDLVFDRFRQVSHTEGLRSREGSGIGLALVQQLTGLLSGRVEVSSTEGAGSTFRIVLPWGSPSAREATRPSITPRPVESFVSEATRWAQRAAAEPPGYAVRPGAAPAPPGEPAEAVGPDDAPTRPRLLLVEDDDDMRDYTSRHLAADHDVVPVADGQAALERLRLDPPIDIVLADLMMPRMDGLTLVRQIRHDNRFRDIPVVLLSARAEAESSTSGLLEGADDYVTKPFRPQDLRARLASILARARSRSRDAAWLRAMLASIQEPLVVTDAEGRVLEINEAFTRAYGWSLADGPLVPPYPWWVPRARHPEERRRAEQRLELMREGQQQLDDRYRIIVKGGGDAWVHLRASTVAPTSEHSGFIIGVVGDETRQHDSRRRRELAAHLAADLAAAEDLESVLATAVTGFTVLFDGDVTLDVSPDRGDPILLGPRGRTVLGDLPAEARSALRGSAPGVRGEGPAKRAGILLDPASLRSRCRAWVQFDGLRVVPPDELIVGDLLAQSLGQAVDRVIDRRDSAVKQEQLERAIESHRVIGQAVGILIERHRATPVSAFEMLRRASLDRNLKLREIAQRVVESGQEPANA
jgi:PAS domain S-box-containing protein